MITAETMLKAKILSHGVSFTPKALEVADRVGAKRQNLVYNQPLGSSKDRPQELLIMGVDRYETVVSCVAPVNDEHIIIDCDASDKLFAEDENVESDISISFVRAPKYYKLLLKNGAPITDYVSACGLDEMNIIPWRGCAISNPCLFCGTNVVTSEKNSIQTAFDLSEDNICFDEYLSLLREAVKIAKNDGCYVEHMHVIIISGNLRDEKLNLQCELYAKIAQTIYADIVDKASEGIIAVTMPPKNLDLLLKLKESGVSKVVFNLEVGNEPYFSRYCPGKSAIGYGHMMEALERSVKVFGKGNVWTNFVLGLEPIAPLLDVCERLAARGVSSSANVLHLDKGNRLDCPVPNFETITTFFRELAMLHKRFGFMPLYCSKALRTSLSNEAFDDRISL
ncbi:hypothetical protein FACS1894187_18180 [Synergistales bacterium]|nr:hypothetical protein FACS1894187_18180 [Synergistales bacterium]